MSVWVRTCVAYRAGVTHAAVCKLPFSGDEISLFVASTVQCQLDEYFVYLLSRDLTDLKKLSAT
jgi:uncharacterized membrane protein